MNNLKGKVAVVTGGARDIGRAVSMKLASEGAKVCINYCHDKTKAEETLGLKAKTTPLFQPNIGARMTKQQRCILKTRFLERFSMFDLVNLMI